MVYKPSNNNESPPPHVTKNIHLPLFGDSDPVESTGLAISLYKSSESLELLVEELLADELRDLDEEPLELNDLDRDRLLELPELMDLALVRKLEQNVMKLMEFQSSDKCSSQTTNTHYTEFLKIFHDLNV